MSKRRQSFVVEISNDFAEGGWLLHAKLASRRKAIAMADSAAKSGELARVQSVADDGERITFHVADPRKVGWLYRLR